MCQITSKNVNDTYAISLSDNDFKSGKLHVESNIRPNRLFTGEAKIIKKRAGKLKTAKIHEVFGKIIEILKS